VGFKLEKDNFWWERLRFEDMGFPEEFSKKYLNFVLPDKFFHFFTCYGLTSLFALGTSPIIAFSIALFIMVILWEVIWDGFFRLGFSIKDLVADTLGASLALTHLLQPELALQTYLFIATKGFLAMWAYSLISKESKKEILVVLLSLCLISTKAFTSDLVLLKHLSFLVGSGICFWWLKNPVIGQDYE